jgi:hypothetical protein
MNHTPSKLASKNSHQTGKVVLKTGKIEFDGSKSYAFCPVTDKKVNENIARANAVLTVTFLGVFVITQSIFILSVLLFDFLLRATNFSQYSPLAFLSKHLLHFFQTKINLINAGPKIFAARIGFLLTFIAVVSILLSWHFTALLIVLILAAFSFLEGAFGICVACIIYPYVYRLIHK